MILVDRLPKFTERLRAFRSRHKGEVGAAALRIAAARALRNPSIRRVVSFFSTEAQPCQWVFMTGCYNSGTTVLRRILSAHPQISGLPLEGEKLTSSFPNMEVNGWVRMWHKNEEIAATWNPEPDTLKRNVAKDWSIWWNNSKPILLEKSIIHTRWMPQLESAFPNAKFIFVVRNGYCAAEGILRRARPIEKAAAILGRDTYLAEEAGQQWLASNRPILTGEGKPTNLHLIHYEDFVSAPFDEIKKLLTFLEADTDALTLLSDGKIKMGDREFQISNQNPASLSRLGPQERASLEALMGDSLEALGYPRGGS